MYLDFFVQHGHTEMPSRSLVPVNDPTLLWINSGVATMKNYFDGKVVPDNPRMTSSQKSIRTNDIENVGKTARHHTMFEMMGNFSVGDYFKKEAITWAWELLTSDEWFGFDPERLYITYYPKDNDAHQFWLDAGVKEDHLLADQDNFWDIGQGPSGPDTEVFYDRGQEMNNLPEDDPESYPGAKTNATWKSGTSSSPSLTTPQKTLTNRYRTRTSIPGWGWNGSFQSLKTPRPTLKPTSSCR